MQALVDWCGARGCFGVDSLALPGDRHTKNFFESFGLVARAIVVHRSAAMSPVVARRGGRGRPRPAAAGRRGRRARRRAGGRCPAAGWSTARRSWRPSTRELREETGLEGVCGPLLGWGEHIEGEHHYVIFDFEVTLVGPR